MSIYKRHTDSKKGLVAFLLMLFLPLIGTIGYMTLEGYRLLDALYMTIITLATVGFREIQPLSDAGKVFTILLIISSIGTYTYAISVITSQFLEGKINNIFRHYRTKSNVKRMKNHVIVVGFGRNGKQAVQELVDRKHPYIIIEMDRELILNNSENGILFMEGDATDDLTLIQAGIQNAIALITTLPNDADNLFVTLTARTLKKDLNIISRASNESAERKIRTAGANQVIIPEKVSGTHMATMVLQPDIVQFLEHLSIQGDSSTNLVEIVCSKLPDEYINKTINEIDIRRLSGANIIGFKTSSGELIVNPTANTVLLPNTKLFVLGNSEQISKMKTIFKL
ncbi:MAG: NAD-binding protein [Bacteroidota bacterium]